MNGNVAIQEYDHNSFLGLEHRRPTPPAAKARPELLGENIWSGTRGLAGALTNMTVLAKRKNSIQQDYPVTFCGTTYEDAEAAYQAGKNRLDFAARQALMA